MFHKLTLEEQLQSHLQQLQITDWWLDKRQDSVLEYGQNFGVGTTCKSNWPVNSAIMVACLIHRPSDPQYQPTPSPNHLQQLHQLLYQLYRQLHQLINHQFLQHHQFHHHQLVLEFRNFVRIFGKIFGMAVVKRMFCSADCVLVRC